MYRDAWLTVSSRFQAVGGDSSDKEKHKDTLLECIETMQQVYTATQKLYEEHGLFVLFLLCIGISYCVPVLVPAGYVEVIWGLSGGGHCLYVRSQFIVMFRQIIA